ncbi:hypothetical protein JXW80_000067 [Salmonella enterica]|nr:hypothetical protein [Salmonella enterica]EFO5647966.1 hypothetical protein [Salmonella enterica subsp. enterica serovar Miami]HBL9889465.1 hypothetical protein [Salmonella enterica subsp. enterica serovar Florida]EEV5516111.1 hypothetical protein [Salmonella enterica]EFI4844505.1 hypothetical protein [Salmonella enterica]
MNALENLLEYYPLSLAAQQLNRNDFVGRAVQTAHATFVDHFKVGWCGLSVVAGHKNDCDFRH